MSSRSFPEERIVAGGVSSLALKITCATCGASEWAIRKPAPDTHFRHKGWAVGKGPKADFCPKHFSTSRRKGTQAMAHIVPVAEKPRDMTREDRRIINDKLDEVYGRDAYKQPWTDESVAKDLGVPRDWVSQVRDQFFGPVGSNPLFDEFLTLREDIERKLGDIAEGAKKVGAERESLLDKIAAFERKLHELDALGKRIERETRR